MSKARLFGHSLLWVFTVSLVILALFVVVARFFSTQVPAYKTELESYLSEEIGGQVNIGTMTARMDGFSPQLSLKDVTLDELKQQTNTLSIGEIRLSMNPLGVLQGNITPNKITIVNTGISIKRFADGHVSIVGFSDEENDSSSGDFSWLLEDGLFEVIDSQIIWKDDLRDEEDIHLSNAHIVFQNINEEHRLKIAASLPDKIGKDFVLSIVVKGDVLSTTDWQADGYLQTEQIQLSEVLQRLDIDEFKINQGVGNVEIWSQWDAAELSRVRGRVHVDEVQMVQKQTNLTVQNVSGLFDWKKLAYGWQLKANEFVFKTNEVQQEKSQFSVQYEQVSDTDTLMNITADGIDIQAVSTVLKQSKLLKKDHYALIQKLNPSGLLKNAYFSFAKYKGGDAWAGCGQLDGFSNEALDSIPAIKNFSSRGCSSKAEGWLDVNTRKGSVYFKKLFRDPLLVDALSGRLAWSYDSGGWRLMSDEIKLETPHIATTTRFSSVIPAEGKPVLLELESNFGAADAIHTSKYLPVGIMGDGVVGWLDSAFKGGQTTGGGVLLKGALKDFPFKNKEGLFQVLFNTKQVNLHYADGWPKLLDVAAEVEFKNEGMTIVSNQGAVAGNAIQHAKIQVPDLAKDSYLSISGVIKDKLPGLYDFFRQSPLKQSVDGLTKHSEVSGLADVTLDIKIPLRKGLKADVKARASIRDGKLTFPELGESVTSLNGEVLYAAQGLSATSIKGKVLGESVLIDIYSDQKNTIISAKGNIKTKTLAAKYPSNVWANISGKSTAQLTVKVPRDGLSTNSAAVLSLESNLDGISIDYPEPVGKALNDVSYLNIKTVLGESPIRVDVDYRGKINSVFVFNQDKNKPLSLSKAGINFGQMPLAVPTHSGIKISGQINELNVPSWQKALGDVNYGENDNNKGVNSIDVHIDKIVWSDKTYKDVTLKASRKRSAWQGQVKNQLLDGEFYLPDGLTLGALVRLNLVRLSLPKLKKGQTKDSLVIDFEPKDFPNLDVNAKRFFVGDADLGSLTMKLRQKTNGLIIQQLDLKSARDLFTAKGAWEKSSNDSITGLTGQLKSESLGDLLKEVGILSDLNGAPSDIYFDLNWPGAPQEFSKDFLNGFATVKSGKGRLLNVEPGLGRVFGLLGLDTLKRRVQLDFSDLVQTGLGFDKIKGRFILVNGDARTNNLYLESPSSRLDIAGRVGLGKEDYDQLITVTPKSTESLPIAGALAGGPVVGAAIYLVQKIAGKTVNKLAGYQYRVTGSWDDPVIKQLSKPGGKVFGIMGDFLSPVFGVLGSDSGTGKKAELLAPVQ